MTIFQRSVLIYQKSFKPSKQDYVEDNNMYDNLTCHKNMCLLFLLHVIYSNNLFINLTVISFIIPNCNNTNFHFVKKLVVSNSCKTWFNYSKSVKE